MNFFNWMVLGISLFGGAAYGADSWVGRLGYVQGEVTIDGQKAKEGDFLKVGNTVGTRSGKCAILLGAKHVIHLDEESLLKITQYMVDGGGENATLDLKYGKTRSLIKSAPGDGAEKKRNFHFRSRAAVMGVRGTHIYIDSPKDPSIPQSFMTIEGVADLKFVKPGDVGAGVAPSVAVLKGGDFVQASGASGAMDPSQMKVERKPPAQIAQMIQQVAPPPMEMKTGMDAKQMGDPNRPMLIGPQAGPKGPFFDGMMLPQLPNVPRLDAVADSVTGVRVTGTIAKQ